MEAEDARRKLVDGLNRKTLLRDPRVADAMAAVPRHRFAPAHTVAEAYEDVPLVLRRDPNGRVVSSISQPSMVAYMLDELRVATGDRVLEIGTASGYNAALLDHLVGEDGQVVSVEIDGSLTEDARKALADTGHARVVLKVGDGREGAPDLAPFDGIVVTAGAEAIAPAWVEQLRDGGRLVVPLSGAADRHETCLTAEKRQDELVELAHLPCGFVPLRHLDEGDQSASWSIQ